MNDNCLEYPEDFPDYLRHTNEDAPVPTWEQVTRSATERNDEMIAHVSRIVAGTTDEAMGRDKWEGLPNNYQRSVALLIDKIYNEGWLDSVGQIYNWPWDGGFFFHPANGDLESLMNTLEGKSSGDAATYLQCSFGKGIFAYLNIRNHRGWFKGWMESDAGMAALHVGVFEDGLAEVHFDLFNPLFIVNAPDEDVIKIPLLGAFNLAMFNLHRRWELNKQFGSIVRTSANFYYILREQVPLSF